MTKKSTKPASPKNWRHILATGSKIVIALILLVIMIPTMGVVWAKDSSQNPEYCANCHGDYYTSWSETTHSLDYKHGEMSISCQTCHDRTVTESMEELVSYANDDYTFPLRERKLPKEECFKCHGSFEEIIPLTAPKVTGLERNPHDSHKGELECGICHNMHRDSVDACSECHDFVIEEPGWQEFMP